MWRLRASWGSLPERTRFAAGATDTARALVSIGMAVAVQLVGSAPAPAGVVAGSELIGCDRADQRLTVSVDSHLDPACTYTKGVTIDASDVTFDCQGALIASTTRPRGIHIVAPTDVALSNVTVRNCVVDGFLNSVKIERDGFRELAEGEEYDVTYSNIVIEDSTFTNSRGVGVFVDGYVTDVTLRRLHIEGTGSSGIYLETGSKDNLVEDNQIVNNGFRENGPGGQVFELGGATFWYWGPGREGISIDGSRTNTVRNNYFEGNSAGGILLYKNCGEYPERDRYFERRYGSHGNVIEGNTFVGGDNGVWVASRMAENTFPMECTDTQYAPGYRLDYANDNVVRGNTFENVTYAIRVEDDRNTIEGNIITSDDPAHVGILIGTPKRTEVLGLPVDTTVVTGNRAEIAGNKNPFRWVHDHINTTFEDNRSFGRAVGLCEGEEPARGPFVMTIAVVALPDPDNPPTGDPPVLPPPDPLPPCPAACDAGAEVSASRMVIRRLASPPGDDRLVLRGELALPYPYDPPVDPVETGVAIVVEDATGARVLDVQIPGGAYDTDRRVGWKTLRRRGWKYVDRGDDSIGGIRSVAVRDHSPGKPGILSFKVVGKGGAYAVAAENLPLSAFFVVDPPTAETGQCGNARFAGTGGCRHTGDRLVCR